MNHKILVLNQKTFLKLATTQAKLHLQYRQQEWRWNLASGLNYNWNTWQRVALAWSLRRPSSLVPRRSTPTCPPCTHLIPWRSCTRQRLLCPHLRTRNSMRTTTHPPHLRHQCHRHLAQKTCAHQDQSPQTLEYPCPHHDVRAISARIVRNPIRLTPVCRNINNTTAQRRKEASQGNPSAANTALKYIHLSERWRCISERTPCLANATCAAKRSPGRGCCRDTSAHTLGKSRSLATTVAVLSRTGPTYALTSRLIPTLRSILVPAAARHSHECPCWASTWRAAAESPGPRPTSTGRRRCLVTRSYRRPLPCMPIKKTEPRRILDLLFSCNTL